MGVDVIEAGFPIASNGDFEAVREIAKIVTESTVCGLARAGAADIERCGEAIRPRQARPHPHLHLHQPGALKLQAADGAARTCWTPSPAR